MSLVNLQDESALAKYPEVDVLRLQAPGKLLKSAHAVDLGYLKAWNTPPDPGWHMAALGAPLLQLALT